MDFIILVAFCVYFILFCSFSSLALSCAVVGKRGGERNNNIFFPPLPSFTVHRDIFFYLGFGPMMGGEEGGIIYKEELSCSLFILPYHQALRHSQAFFTA